MRLCRGILTASPTLARASESPLEAVGHQAVAEVRRLLRWRPGRAGTLHSAARLGNARRMQSRILSLPGSLRARLPVRRRPRESASISGDGPVAMSDVHFLILGMRTGKTACRLPIYAFYPQTETAHVGKRSVPGADGAPINCTSTAFRSPAKRVAAYWIRKLIFGGQLKSTPMMASETREIKRRTYQLV